MPETQTVKRNRGRCALIREQESSPLPSLDRRRHSSYSRLFFVGALDDGKARRPMFTLLPLPFSLPISRRDRGE